MIRQVLSMLVSLFFMVWKVASSVSGIYATETSDIYTFTWSPDGKFIAVSHYEDVVHIIELETGEARPLQSSPIAARELVWSPNGQYLATTTFDIYPGELTVIDIARDKMIFSSKNIAMRGVYYTSVSWSPDGTRLAVAYEFGTGSSAQAVFSIWDVSRGKWSVQMRQHPPGRLTGIR